MPPPSLHWTAFWAAAGRMPQGRRWVLSRLAIDTGYEAPAVYGWARRAGFAQVAPVKGVEGFNRASPVSGPVASRRFDGPVCPNKRAQARVHDPTPCATIHVSSPHCAIIFTS